MSRTKIWVDIQTLADVALIHKAHSQGSEELQDVVFCALKRAGFKLRTTMITWALGVPKGQMEWGFPTGVYGRAAIMALEQALPDEAVFIRTKRPFEGLMIGLEEDWPEVE